jgi:hypothetical protein
MAAPRPVLHLPVIAGASAVAYGLALAFVTSLQASADARVAAARLPIETAVRDAASQRVLTAREVRRAGRILEDAAAAYDRALRASSALDEALAALAGGVESASGAAARLPDRIALPAPRIQVVQVAAPPPVQATTGASGK